MASLPTFTFTIGPSDFAVPKALEPKCPLCGAAALYVGMVNTECATRDCANCQPGLPPEKVPDWGSYAWALVKHASGERVGYFDGYTFIEANPVFHKHDGPYRGWTLI